MVTSGIPPLLPPAHAPVAMGHTDTLPAPEHTPPDPLELKHAQAQTAPLIAGDSFYADISSGPASQPASYPPWVDISDQNNVQPTSWVPYTWPETEQTMHAYAQAALDPHAYVLASHGHTQPDIKDHHHSVHPISFPHPVGDVLRARGSELDAGQALWMLSSDEGAQTSGSGQHWTGSYHNPTTYYPTS
jgi:hypothetical protein